MDMRSGCYAGQTLNKKSVKKIPEGQPTNAGRDNTLIVVRVDTNAVLFKIKGKLAELDMLQFIFVKIWPSPDACVDNMRETLATSYL